MNAGFATRALAALCLGILLLHGGPALAQELELKGWVRGADGNPKVSARVQLVRSGGSGQYIAVTSQEGRFTIGSFQAGRYLVRIRQGNEVQEFVENIASREVEFVVNW
jgi:hypothetical protein